LGLPAAKAPPRSRSFLRSSWPSRASAACRRLVTVPGVSSPLSPRSMIRRTSADPEISILSGPGSKPQSVGRGRVRRWHLQMRGPAGADPAVRGRQRHADPLPGPAYAQGLGFRVRTQSTMRKARIAPARRSPPSCTRCCTTKPSPRRHRPSAHQTGDRIELSQGATPKGWSRRWHRFYCMRPTTG
jgi:hypothetical protein